MTGQIAARSRAGGQRSSAGRGVPIDLIGAGEALERTMSAVAERRFVQVCTVNLDFLVNARRDPQVRTILHSSELNVADGAPSSGLRGCSAIRRRGGSPARTFVPLLMESAARNDARVFFLGGENGAAVAAAARLRERLPDLSVTVHEPPRRSLEAMDHDDILRRIEDGGADILLVAFGHPKQDKWIALNRTGSRPRWRSGVGCTFDLIAGHRTRAPSWMRERGLEWFYRFLREPRRLGGRYALDACGSSRPWCRSACTSGPSPPPGRRRLVARAPDTGGSAPTFLRAFLAKIAALRPMAAGPGTREPEGDLLAVELAERGLLDDGRAAGFLLGLPANPQICRWSRSLLHPKGSFLVV